MPVHKVFGITFKTSITTTMNYAIDALKYTNKRCFVQSLHKTFSYISKKSRIA